MGISSKLDIEVSTKDERTNMTTEEPKFPKDIQGDFEYFKQWVKEAEPVEFIEYNQENSEKVSRMKPEYVATYHDTCDRTQVTTGYHDFGPEPSCCWYTHGWYICKNEHTVDDYITAGSYGTCLSCNPTEDEDFDEENADKDCGTCYGDGNLTYYFDNYVDLPG